MQCTWVVLSVHSTLPPALQLKDGAETIAETDTDTCTDTSAKPMIDTTDKPLADLNVATMDDAEDPKTTDDRFVISVAARSDLVISYARVGSKTCFEPCFLVSLCVCVCVRVLCVHGGGGGGL